MSEHDDAPDEAPHPPESPAEPAPDLAAELDRCREALAAKTREAEAHWDRYLRTLAEYDNARKRAVRDREEYTRTANEALIRELLPVLDNFDRALAAARGDAGAAAVTAGVELIQRELLRVLEKFGVTPFTSIGMPFDPERHEAVARVPTGAEPEMTVVGETARGYLLHGRVLRPALVTVAMSPEPGPAVDDAS
jgi:molecular chaperone GrpE